MNTIARKERTDRDVQNQFDLKQLELLKLEEDEFQRYAQQVIDNAQHRGRNTHPLKVSIFKGRDKLHQIFFWIFGLLGN